VSAETAGARPATIAAPAPPAKRRWRIRDVVSPLVSVIALGAVVAWATRQRTPHLPTDAGGLALLGAAVAVYGLTWIARGTRWHLILRRAAIEHDPIDAHGLVAVGYMGNTVLPARGGEVLRMLLLPGRSSAGRREALGSILAERLVDAIVLALLFAALTWVGIGGAPLGQAPAIVAAAVSGIVVAAGVVLISMRKRGRLQKLARAAGPYVAASKNLLGGFGLRLAALTAVIWALEGTICLIVGDSLGVHLDPLDALFVMVLASFFAIIPAAPGAVGTFDGAVLLGLGAGGVPGGQAVAFALLIRFVIYVPITLLGLAFLIARYGGLATLRRRAAEA
jgi:glycosyltransferase 2 family protein